MQSSADRQLMLNFRWCGERCSGEGKVFFKAANSTVVTGAGSEKTFNDAWTSVAATTKTQKKDG